MIAEILKYLKCNTYFGRCCPLGLARGLTERYRIICLVPLRERAAQNITNVQYRNSVLLKYCKSISNTLFTKF